MNKITKAINILTDSDFRKDWKEARRLYKTPRYTETTADLFGSTISVPDTASFLFMKDELFKEEIYKFRCDKKAPVIIDGGANIGLASIYFKQQYPNAKIIVFEADPYIAGFFKKNVLEAFQFDDVQLVEKALWKEITTLHFHSEKADAGRIGDSKDGMEVHTDLLSNYLKSEVDFLKLDIEGAEVEVLQECASGLLMVQNIFVEYHSFENREQQLAEILNILKQAGFRIHITAPGLTSDHPLWERKTYEGMDLQLNIFGFRS